VEELLWKALNESKTDSIAAALYMALGDLYDYQEDFDKAADMYRAVLQKDKSNLMALNNLAWLKALDPKKPNCMEALALIDRAIKLVGETPELLDTRAVIRLSMTPQPMFREAIVDLENVTQQIKEPKASHYFHLAWAYSLDRDRKESLQKAKVSFKKAEDEGLNAKNVHPLEKDVFKIVATRLSRQ
jgi:tetratricopeptide (TPR) repeat protein